MPRDRPSSGLNQTCAMSTMDVSASAGHSSEPRLPRAYRVAFTSAGPLSTGFVSFTDTCLTTSRISVGLSRSPGTIDLYQTTKGNEPVLYSSRNVPKESHNHGSLSSPIRSRINFRDNGGTMHTMWCSLTALRMNLRRSGTTSGPNSLTPRLKALSSLPTPCVLTVRLIWVGLHPNLRGIVNSQTRRLCKNSPCPT